MLVEQNHCTILCNDQEQPKPIGRSTYTLSKHIALLCLQQYTYAYAVEPLTQQHALCPGTDLQSLGIHKTYIIFKQVGFVAQENLNMMQRVIELAFLQMQFYICQVFGIQKIIGQVTYIGCQYKLLKVQVGVKFFPSAKNPHLWARV